MPTPNAGLMIEEDRYKRQTLLWGGDNQKILTDARVAVVGADQQGRYLALGLTALGIGNVVLIDGEETKEGEQFLGEELPAGSRAVEIARILRKVNTQISIEAYPTNLEGRVSQQTLFGSDHIVDATNSTLSKQLAVQYAREKGIAIHSTSGKWGYSKLTRCDPSETNGESLMPMFDGEEQDALMALVMCGVTTEEVRKSLFNDSDNFLNRPVRFVLGGDYRFGFPEPGREIPRPDKELYADMKVAFLGSGAIGCWAAIAAAEMGFGRADQFDYDAFDSTNINRQVLGYDGIGILKAKHIAKKIRQMSKGKVKSVGRNVKILPGFDTRWNYDLVFDFVDNPYTRAVNTAHAIQRGIPMISSASQPYSARSLTQVDGETQCQDCVLDMYDKGRRDEMIRRASCATNPDPSVVMSNAIAGAMAVLETFTVVEPGKFGRPFNGELIYRSSLPSRFGTSELSNPCDCYNTPVPDLNISDADVANFAKENPHLLR